MSNEEKNRIEKLMRASEIVRALDDRETEIAKLVAIAMQTGYDLRRMSEEREKSAV